MLEVIYQVADADPDEDGNPTGDGVPDVWEEKVHLRTDKQDTVNWVRGNAGDFSNSEPRYLTSEGDSEVFARMHERMVTTDASKDWANDGINYHENGAPFPDSDPTRCNRYPTYPRSVDFNIPDPFPPTGEFVHKDYSNVEFPTLPSETDPNG